MTKRTAGPTGALTRIGSLDVLRGFALLGILVMNIQLFSMPSAAYTNPTAWGDLEGVNLVVWMLGQAFANMKFVTLFSMLFGAGVCLFADRLEARGRRPAAVHYRRMGWLLVFGLTHAYLLWPGDILVLYAFCGCLVFLFRRKSARTLIASGLAIFAVGSLLMLGSGVILTSPVVPEEAVVEIERDWSGTTPVREAELEAFRGGWSAQQPARVQQALTMHFFLFPLLMLWFCVGNMLFGMALYRLGVLGAERGDRFYGRLAAIGLGAGMPLVATGIWWNFAADWSWDKAMFHGFQFNYWGCIGVALGYLALVMLAVRRRAFPGLQARLAATGRMAFTNYILQTVVCTTIFYGHGLGLFGSVERWGQFLVVIAVTGLQLWLSPIWLRHFAYGPLEWAWRSLTYWRMPPIRIRA